MLSFTRRPTHQACCCFMYHGACQALVPPGPSPSGLDRWLFAASLPTERVIDQRVRVTRVTCGRSAEAGSRDLTSRVTSAHINIKTFLRTFQRRSEPHGRHPAPPPVFTMVISGSYPPGWRGWLSALVVKGGRRASFSCCLRPIEVLNEALRRWVNLSGGGGWRRAPRGGL